MFSINPFEKDNQKIDMYISNQKMKDFEAKHKLPPEKEKLILYGFFGAFIFKESFRVFEVIGNIDIETHLNLLDVINIDDTVKSAEKLEHMSVAQDLTLISNELYQYFVVEENPMPHSLDTLPSVISGLEKTWEWSLKQTIAETQAYLEENPVFTKEKEETIWQAFAQKYMIEKICYSLTAYKKSVALLKKLDFFTDEDIQYIQSIKDFSAFDLARVIHISKITCHLGYLEEEKAWEYIERSNQLIKEKYHSWKSFFLAYILGRALGLSHQAKDTLEGIEFIFDHPESPIKNVPFK